MTSLTLRTQSWQEGSGLGDVAEKGVLTRYGAADLHAGRKSLNRWQANGLICCTAAHACMPRQAVIRGQSLLSSAAFAVADSRGHKHTASECWLYLCKYICSLLIAE